MKYLLYCGLVVVSGGSVGTAFAAVANTPPVISGTPTTAATPNTPYLFQPIASDADGDTLSFVIKKQPAWTEFNEATGELSGTPVATDHKNYSNIRIGANDGTKTTWLNRFSIRVSNTKPTISGTPEKTVYPNAAYTFQPTASDADGDELSFVIKNQPAWANFNEATGELSGTPTTEDRNKYKNIRIGATDGQQTQWSTTFSITVPNTLPVISGTPENAILAGQDYSFLPLANDTDGDELSYSIKNKPVWADFNSETGLLSGTPGAEHRKNHSGIRIGVKDVGTKTVWLKSFSIRVNNNLPVISGTPDTRAKVGEIYSFTPTATDDDNEALRFTISKRPRWATFNKATGELSGTPALRDEGQSFENVTIKAIDTKSGKATLAAFSINVVNENYDEPPIISGVPETTINSGQAYRFTPVTQYSGGGELTFSINNKPDWADFDESTGTLSGTPQASNAGNSNNIRISVSDSIQDAVKLDAFKIKVNAVQTSYKDAHRLLVQASFGPTTASLEAIMKNGITAWVDEQLDADSAYQSTGDAHQTHLERTLEIARAAEPGTAWDATAVFNQTTASHTVDDYQMATWWENALGHPTKTAHGSDQLRQRVAYALSQIMVVSNKEAPLYQRGESLAFYYDILARNALGNFRTLLNEVTRSPTMGLYLSHQGNEKADPDAATRPDENFAREVIQLFSIGLYELNLDGSPNRDGNPDTYPDAGDQLVPTYTQDDIAEMAKVMTGWDLVGNNRYGKNTSRTGDYTQFMEFTPSEHEDEVAEGGDGMVTIMGQTFTLNSGADGSGLDAALDLLFQHPNTGPFISHLLIQRMVTSNPSSEYVARVASVFNNNGSGVRGDLKAVVRAILLDTEARNSLQQFNPAFGKGKEPLLALTQFLRAFNVRPLDGWLGKDKQTPVNGVYWYKYPERDFAQGALRANSVFNFYLPDFVPSDTYFNQNRQTAPELQIQTDQTLVEMNNKLLSLITNGEVNKIQTISNKTLAEWAAAGKNFWSGEFMMIDFDEELRIYEQALDGDSNGDFANMIATDPVTDERYKSQAIDTLLEHLNQKLLGGTMPNEHRAALKHYLLDGHRATRNDNYKEAWANIKDAVRFIITSNAFMVQK
uniref:Cadherin domain-containing protein n=1 Tax=uncultured Thiotrichaceae bacterium TaxID=298394 RepID=A0A6S6U8C1_9GAMM|nr:MAG: FIG01201902: hypothetical protein [uncultured Thiotrichaceae bacterium]